MALLTLLLVVIVLVASLLVRHRQAGQGDENVSRVVRTTAIAVRDVPVFLNAVGTVTPSTTVIVRAQVQGTLASINFREGQVVARGDLLATIDDRALRAQLQTAEGALLRDRAQLANGYRKFNRPFWRVWRVGSGRASAALGTDRAQIGGSCVGFRHRGATQRLSA